MATGEITIALSDLLWIAGFITAIAGAWKVLKDNPIAKHETRLEELETASESTTEMLEKQAETNKMILNSLMVIIEHDITGNGIENMKKIRDEMHDFLIKK